MKGYIYTIYDAVAEEYAPLFTANNDDVARRRFTQSLQNIPPHMQHDFVLERIGYYEHDGQWKLSCEPATVHVDADIKNCQSVDNIKAAFDGKDLTVEQFNAAMDEFSKKPLTKKEREELKNVGKSIGALREVKQ